MSLLSKAMLLGMGVGVFSAAEASYTRLVRCESISHNYRECDVGGEILDAYVESQLSGASCREGRSWGIGRHDDYLWVDEGCRAIFRVRIRDNHWNEE